LDWTSTRKRRTLVRTTRTPEYGLGLPSSVPGPLDGVRIPSSKGRTTHNEVPGQGIPWSKQGSGTGTCPGLILHLRSPLRRRPDAATWFVARDVSQRAEPDARPLGRAVSAFIAERTRRLSTLLTDDVPLQHLMRPVHSAGRRRQGHPADGVPVQSIVKQCARAMGCTVESHLEGGG
jgi:hypothetical protein